MRSKSRITSAIENASALSLILVVVASCFRTAHMRQSSESQQKHDQAVELVKQVRRDMYEIPATNALGAIATEDPAVLRRFHDLGDAAVGPLFDLLADPHPACRTAALQALTVIAEERATALNVTLLVDRSDSVRMAAAQDLSLLFLGSPITKYSGGEVDISVKNLKRAQSEMLGWLSKDALVDDQLPLPPRENWKPSGNAAPLYGGWPRAQAAK